MLVFDYIDQRLQNQATVKSVDLQPTELLETVEVARLDGCGTLGIYWRIMLPLARPAVGAVAIFTFLMVWNDLWWPIIYLNSPENATLTLALAGFARSFRVAVDLLMAAAVMIIIPCIIVYFAAQKYFIRGIHLTGGKG